ncbi:DsbA family protein [Cognatishimia maritima]|uniref:Protein-disulfide isomerase n=1 Tax=Cognatishimia maritima TaxID=870908 RepID=A0A1M5IKK0_9RHOB|nr:DsbA family protein [Cognatishimia maritima]SHG28303.1 Protein-disulfide isomerase [Cognatishimia maritima]
MKTPILAAAFALLALPGQALDINAMTDEERAIFREEVRAYLLDNPEVIMEAVSVLEQRQAQAEAQRDFTLVSANAADIFEDGFSWVGGNPDGDITLVEFVDYRCGYCRRAHDEVKDLITADGNIKIIMKEFPILGEASVVSSQFAIAVKQLAGADAYEAAHDALITMRANATEPRLRRLAETLNLDADAVMSHMKSAAVNDEIEKTRELAQRLQITGTPTFVFDDELVRGYLPLPQMQQVVAAKRG